MKTKTGLRPTRKAGSLERKSPHKVMIVEDHPITREGVAQLLSEERELAVCGQFEDAGSAFNAIARLHPDIAIVDLSLKTSNGFELIKSIKTSYPKLLIVVFSMHDELLYAERALRAGANGYVMKQESPETLLRALRHVIHGGIYLSDRVNGKIMQQVVSGRPISGGALVDRISDRELEIFGLIGQGRGTRQIAEQLNLSIKTIESHRAHIKEKLNLKSGTELVHCAIQMRAEQAI